MIQQLGEGRKEARGNGSRVRYTRKVSRPIVGRSELMRIAVTGAYGFSGQYIAQRLLGSGHEIITLTNSPNRKNAFGKRIQAFRHNFTRPAELEKSLLRVDTLINNYWVRFDHPPQFTFAKAIANSKVLLDAAKRAGVRRVVHVSITNPECKSDLPYFSGKAEVEAYLRSTGMSYSILRPAVLFGKEDILINNIAWADADTSPPPIPADLRRRLCRMRNEGGDARSN